MNMRCRGIMFFITLIILLTSSSCTEQSSFRHQEKNVSNQSEQKADESNTDQVENLAGIYLGMDGDEAAKILGSSYEKEEYEDDAGYMGEAAYQLEYDGIRLIIGQESKRVLEIDAYSDKIETALGIKVGDSFKDALDLYGKKYKEVISRHDGLVLTGWFDIGDNMVIIFDNNKEDIKLVNENIKPESRIEAIYMKYLNNID